MQRKIHRFHDLAVNQQLNKLAANQGQIPAMTKRNRRSHRYNGNLDQIRHMTQGCRRHRFRAGASHNGLGTRSRGFWADFRGKLTNASNRRQNAPCTTQSLPLP